MQAELSVHNSRIIRRKLYEPYTGQVNDKGTEDVTVSSLIFVVSNNMINLFLYFSFALRQCIVHVPGRHKITNPLIPKQAGVIPTPTGSHYEGLVLRYIERAASAPKRLCYYLLLNIHYYSLLV